MICITGAGGTVGSEILGLLERRRIRFRAAFFSAAKAKAAAARGIDAATIDYRQPATLAAAFQGCDAVFLLAPQAVDQESLERNAVEAAAGAGVRRIVKQSVVGAADEGYRLARVHRAVERAIEDSGMAWTFLRPNSFMQNTAGFMAPAIRAGSTFYSASGQARIAHVDVRDIAAVAVAALAGGHEGQAYTLTGPEALCWDEVAAELSRALGRAIAHVDLPPEALRAGMHAAGMPAAIADQLLDLQRWFREGGADATSDDIRRVTGSAPRRFADYARETAATGMWDADPGPATG